MQIHDLITNMAASMDVTFDAAYVCSVFFFVACLGGQIALVGLFCDAFLILSRVFRRLLQAVLHPILHLLKVHFQK